MLQHVPTKKQGCRFCKHCQPELSQEKNVTSATSFPAPPAGGWTHVVLNPIRQFVRGRQRVQDLRLMLNG